MAKEKNAGTPAAKKFSSAGKKRSAADLKGSEKGSIIRIIRSSASLANQNNRTGLDLGDKNSAKNLAGRLNSAVKPNGKVDVMDSGSDQYKALKSLASKALPSLKSSSYDGNVKALLGYVLKDLAGTGGGGKRGFNPNALSDISL